MNQPKALRAAVINLGCAKNRVDAEIIMAKLGQAGYLITSEPANAQVVIINTCGFLQEAIEEANQLIESFHQKRKTGELNKLLVTGCIPQRNPTEILAQFPWVDAFVGIDQIPDIPRIIEEPAKRGRLLVSPIPSWNPGSEHPRLLSTPRHYTYLRLTEGCSNSCSYCTIPTIRGPVRFRNPEDILSEALNLAKMGTKELILIAQDTTAHPSFNSILRKLEKIDDLRWIRILYAHPAHLAEETLELIAESDKLLNYIDLPIQHLADSVLKRMNRKVSKTRIKKLITKARKLDANFALRTTLMVGFPGETDEDFQEMKQELSEMQLTHLGIFIFSPEKGTPASLMGNQIPFEKAKERAIELIELAEEMQMLEYERLKGSIQEAVIDYCNAGGAVGRLWSDAPEIDRVVKIKGNCLKQGQFAKLKVLGGTDDYIIADWINSI